MQVVLYWFLFWGFLFLSFFLSFKKKKEEEKEKETKAGFPQPGVSQQEDFSCHYGKSPFQCPS
eukprot:m.49940 g.49940  ORF g.49940 m.49940 type:complete len:63 (-) comp15097_c0_seq2:74-262(-)